MVTIPARAKGAPSWRGSVRATRIPRVLAVLGFVACASIALAPGCVSSIAESTCSSCQESYTDEQCKKWGDLAGCATAVSAPGSCDPNMKGCSFESCNGGPICDDTGAAQCAGATSLTQADCDELGKAASCTSSKTGMFTTQGGMVTGCDFLGCKFAPDCP
jgi:hypothetical protein